MSQVIVNPKINNSNSDKQSEQIWGNWKYISVAGKDNSRHDIWNCECQNCFTIQEINSSNLRRGRKVQCHSCGYPYDCKFDNSNTWPVDGVAANGVVTFNIDRFKSQDNTNADDTHVNPSVSPSNSNSKLNTNLPTYACTLREEKKDLFSVPFYYQILCCVSKDGEWTGTSKRIAELINLDMESFNFINKDEFWDFEDGADNIPFECVYIEGNCAFLICKKHKYDKLNLNTLKLCLEKYKSFIQSNTKYIAMPRIGCGKNGLDWETQVKPMILEVFSSLPINILVCYE